METYYQLLLHYLGLRSRSARIQEPRMRIAALRVAAAWLLRRANELPTYSQR